MNNLIQKLQMTLLVGLKTMLKLTRLISRSIRRANFMSLLIFFARTVNMHLRQTSTLTFLNIIGIIGYMLLVGIYLIWTGPHLPLFY